MKKITIDPVTRIEGHAKITIDLDDSGKVTNARMHVTQLRGFEKFCVGRPFTEMPSLTARTCGICPVSHLISASKACDMILAVKPPHTGRQLRRVINLAQIMQSHALNFFHLSSPDLLLGFDAPKEDRNIFNLIKTHPDIARNGIGLRAFGQKIIEQLGGKRIHPGWIVPGGVSHKLEPEIKDWILKGIPEQIKVTRDILDWFKKEIKNFNEEIRTFANYPTLFLGLVNDNGELEHYDGKVRVMDHIGKIVADKLDPREYQSYIGEAVEEDSYLKSPFYKPFGYPNGVYRVGPLARLNIADRCGTPIADEEHAEFKSLERGPILSSFFYHYARLIEIIYCLEKIEMILKTDDILDPHIRSFAEPNRLEGIGMSEAPRGTLMHHYRIDENGLITFANLIIASGNNNLAMNHGVYQVAKHFIDGNNITDGALNRVEAVIRAFDPCLSCSTHAIGKMPLMLELRDSNKKIVDIKTRGI
ncbi:MAG: Ni/Fe hydrogenase subunit alpha [Campylobacterales bacterium]|nr:Ni/Fe hydrogenase subunit alpha [Campylobacterales bacterium]